MSQYALARSIVAGYVPERGEVRTSLSGTRRMPVLTVESARLLLAIRDFAIAMGVDDPTIWESRHGSPAATFFGLELTVRDDVISVACREQPSTTTEERRQVLLEEMLSGLRARY